MAVSKNVMMERIQKKFALNAVDATDFYGYESDGIWIRDDICTEKTGFYNYADGTMDDSNVLNKFLNKAGWFAEPYDSETIMLYKM